MVYPRTKAQLRIVHLVRNTLRYVTDKNRRVVVEVTETGRALETLAEPRLRHWEYVIVVFDYAYRNVGSSTAHTLSKIRPCASARGCKPSSWISAGSPATPSSRNGISGMS